MKRLIILMLYVAAAQAEFPAEITQPNQEGTILLADSVQDPIFGTVVGNYVYFSAGTGSHICPGKDLFRVAIPQSGESPSQPEVEPIAVIKCLLNLQSDGKQLLVMTQREKGENSPYDDFVWDGEKLVDLKQFHAKFGAESAWLFDWEKAHSNIDWTDPAQRSPLAVGMQADGWFRQWFIKEGQEPRVLSLSVRNARGKIFPMPLPKDFEPSCAGNPLSWDGKGNLYTLLRPYDSSTGFSRLYVRQTDGKTVMYGGDIPYHGASPWVSLKKTGEHGWTIRSATSIVGIPQGVLVLDQTDYQNEWESVVFFPAEGDSVYRVQLKTESISGAFGLSVNQQGIVLSQPLLGKITQYDFPKAQATRGGFEGLNKKRTLGRETKR